VARQTDATAAYIVDASIAEMSNRGAEVPRATIGRVRDRGGPTLEAGTLEELCDGLAGWGIHSGRALDTLRGYNSALLNGRADGLVADPTELGATPIAGLYAAGCDVGFVSNRGYMGGLATALVTGRVAGRAAAAS